MSKPNGILAMNPAQYREIDGVVFDLDSYARHCQPTESPQPAQMEQPQQPDIPANTAAPAPVFAVEPVHQGWYDGGQVRPPVPVMAGALPPVQCCVQEGGSITLTHAVFLPVGSGSGSGSYLTSYTTSYLTSYRSSGSGSYVFGSCTYRVGGYGLELV